MTLLKSLGSHVWWFCHNAAMSGDWQPLGVREGWETGYDSLHDGVPNWLRQSLADWVRERLVDAMGNPQRALLRVIERVLRWPLDWRWKESGALATVLNGAGSQPKRFLGAVDLLLSRLDAGRSDHSREAAALEIALRQGGSLWRVVNRNGTLGLEQRVDEAVQKAAEKAMQPGDPAGRLLSDAWHALYGREPDPSEAYRDAVRAVEAAAKPVITPKDPKATLGKMIGAMREAPGKWTFPISAGASGVDTVRELMDLVWQGQKDRHGDPDIEGPVDVGREEAEVAVHAAVTLVHWFRSGAVVPKA